MGLYQILWVFYLDKVGELRNSVTQAVFLLCDHRMDEPPRAVYFFELPQELVGLNAVQNTRERDALDRAVVRTVEDGIVFAENVASG